MKQQDIAVILIIVFIAGVFAFIMSSKFITPSNEKRTAEKVSAITSDFPLPDESVFNKDAINPTVRIQIAPNDNDQPFTTAD